MKKVYTFDCTHCGHPVTHEHYRWIHVSNNVKKTADKFEIKNYSCTCGCQKATPNIDIMLKQL